MLATRVVGSEWEMATIASLGAAKAKCGRTVSAPNHARLTLLDVTTSRGSRAETGAVANASSTVQPIRSHVATILRPINCSTISLVAVLICPAADGNVR